MTTVAYFGLPFNADGAFVTSDQGWIQFQGANLQDMVTRAHMAGDRVVVVTTAFDNATICNLVYNTTATAIHNTAAAIQMKNLDGVNVDFEGSNTTCPNGQSLQSGLTSYMTKLKAALPQSYVTIDVYSGSASWDSGEFRIDTLAPVVDAMFVMAYDMNFSNMQDNNGDHAGPTAPLNPGPLNWPYNDSTAVQQFLSKAPASKIILGVPWYGYKWCTQDNTDYSLKASTTIVVNNRNHVVCPHDTPTHYIDNPAAEAYGGIAGDVLQCVGAVNQFSQHRDSNGQTWAASWFSPAANDPCGGNHNSWRELYYDDATSLGLKYDLVNANNLLGTGMWALGDEGSTPDFWNELAAKFFLPLGSGGDPSSWGPGRLDVFAKGTDNALWHRYYAARGWSVWSSLGGQITSEPAAVSWGPGRIDVFARGTSNDLQHIFYSSSSGWSPWYSHGGSLASGPDVASWGPGRLDVFARGAANSDLQHIFYSTGAGWTTWFSHGGTLTSDPGAVSWGYGRIDVFAKGAANDLQHIYYGASSGWSQWYSHGGTLGSGPDPSSWGPGRLDVFAQDGTGALQHIYYASSVGAWSAFSTLGGSLTSDPGAVSWGPGRIDVFARGSDDSLQHILYSGGWSGWFRQ